VAQEHEPLGWMALSGEYGHGYGGDCGCGSDSGSGSGAATLLVCSASGVAVFDLARLGAPDTPCVDGSTAGGDALQARRQPQPQHAQPQLQAGCDTASDADDPDTPLATPRLGGPVTSLALHPPLVALGSTERRIAIADAGSMRLLCAPVLGVAVRDLAFGRGGALLAAACADDAVRLYDCS
jgi:hypothetical protein